MPFAEKDDAAALGARWDPALGRWYVPKGVDPAAFARWERDDLDGVPGEDRSYAEQPGLYVDLVPKSGWAWNVRSEVSAVEWERIRHFVYDRVGSVCEVCGVQCGRGDRPRIEAHERWAYDLPRGQRCGTQRLARLIGLCRPCHAATHLAHAGIVGEDRQARAHLKSVNGWDDGQLGYHLARATSTWCERNAMLWTLDLTIIMNAGIPLANQGATR